MNASVGQTFCLLALDLNLALICGLQDHIPYFFQGTLYL